VEPGGSNDVNTSFLVNVKPWVTFDVSVAAADAGTLRIGTAV
jgi:hypothetical protein